jgi:hypothetical protein
MRQAQNYGAPFTERSFRPAGSKTFASIQLQFVVFVDEFGQHVKYVNKLSLAHVANSKFLAFGGLEPSTINCAPPIFDILKTPFSARGVSMSSGYPGPGLPEVSHQHWARSQLGIFLGTC